MKPRVQTSIQKRGQDLVFTGRCSYCGRSHSAKTPADLLRWWRAHRKSSEEDNS